jgi:NAD(P)-dependent dehydrogenase (short-subunit alcohol dehydrogenase family)
VVACAEQGRSAAAKSLVIEYARRGIRVNSISPGIVKSPMHPVVTLAQLGALDLSILLGSARSAAKCVIASVRDTPP